MRLNRKFAGSAVGVGLLAGAGGAWAVSSSSSSPDGRDAFLNDVAGRLNVTPDKLKGAIQGALDDQLDAAVKAGRLTQKQADEIKKHAREDGGVPPILGPGLPGPNFRPGLPGRSFRAGPGGPPPFPGPPPPGGPPPFAGPPPPGGRGPDGPIGAGFDAAAKYLGLTDGQLRRRLMAGKSLAQVAAAQNKDLDGLKSAIETGVKAELEKAVADKRLTQQQEDDILKGLHERIDELVNRKGPDRPPPPPGRLRGHHW